MRWYRRKGKTGLDSLQQFGWIEDRSKQHQPRCETRLALLPIGMDETSVNNQFCKLTQQNVKYSFLNWFMGRCFFVFLSFQRATRWIAQYDLS
jgi:hypothetical protein